MDKLKQIVDDMEKYPLQGIPRDDAEWLVKELLYHKKLGEAYLSELADYARTVTRLNGEVRCLSIRD